MNWFLPLLWLAGGAVSSDKAPLVGVRDFLVSTFYILCMLSASFSLNVLGHCLHRSLCLLLLCFFNTIKSENFLRQWQHSTLPWLQGTLLCKRSVWTLSPESVLNVKSHTLHFIFLTVDSIVPLLVNKSFYAIFIKFIVLVYSASNLLYLEPS